MLSQLLVLKCVVPLVELACFSITKAAADCGYLRELYSLILLGRTWEKYSGYIKLVHKGNSLLTLLRTEKSGSRY